MNASIPIDLTNELDDEQCYKTVLPALLAIPKDRLRPLNLDVSTAVATVRGCYDLLLGLRAEIVENDPRFNPEVLDNLDNYAGALSYAHSQVNSSGKGVGQVRSLLAEATEARDRLRADVLYLCRRGLLEPGVLKNCRGRKGYINVGEELFLLVGLLRANWTRVEGCCCVTTSEIDKADRFARLTMLRARGLDQDEEETRSWVEMRLRAFTLFVQAYDEVRRAVLHVRFSDKGICHTVPSLYKKVNRRKPKQTLGENAAAANSTLETNALSASPGVLPLQMPSLRASGPTGECTLSYPFSGSMLTLPVWNTPTASICLPTSQTLSPQDPVATSPVAEAPVESPPSLEKKGSASRRRRSRNRRAIPKWLEAVGNDSRVGRETAETIVQATGESDNLARVMPELEALAPEKVGRVNEDIAFCVASALAALPRILSYREEIARERPELDLSCFDKLKDYAFALLQANAAYQACCETNSLPALGEEALRIRSMMYEDLSALADRGLVDKSRFKSYTGKAGYTATAQDINILVAIAWDSWTAIEGRAGLQRSDLDHAHRLETRILRLVGLQGKEAEATGKAAELRARAYTVFRRCYESIRRVIAVEGARKASSGSGG